MGAPPWVSARATLMVPAANEPERSWPRPQRPTCLTARTPVDPGPDDRWRTTKEAPSVVTPLLSEGEVGFCRPVLGLPDILKEDDPHADFADLFAAFADRETLPTEVPGKRWCSVSTAPVPTYYATASS